MSECRWCKGTGKYYPLTGEPEACRECLPIPAPDPIGLDRINSITQKVLQDMAKKYAHTATSPIVGLAIRNMDVGEWDYIDVCTSPHYRRLIGAKRKIYVGDILRAEDVEMDVSKMPVATAPTPKGEPAPPEDYNEQKLKWIEENIKAAEQHLEDQMKQTMVDFYNQPRQLQLIDPQGLTFATYGTIERSPCIQYPSPIVTVNGSSATLASNLSGILLTSPGNSLSTSPSFTVSTSSTGTLMRFRS